MSLRDTLNNNSSVVTILAVVVLVIALGIIVMTNKGPGSNSYIVDLYFYDLNTGKIFIAKSDQRPPIPTESGPTPNGNNAGVMAYIVACGECGNYNGMTAEEVKAAGAAIVRLEMMSPQAIAAMEKADSNPDAMLDIDMMNAMLIKRPEDTQWVMMESMAGQRILSQEMINCPSGAPKTCLPGR